MNNIKILYKGIWTAFQGESDVGTNSIRLLLHNQPGKMNIFGMDSFLWGYAGIERAKLIAAAPEMYNLLVELSEANDADFAIVYSRFLDIQKKAKELLENIDYKGEDK